MFSHVIKHSLIMAAKCTTFIHYIRHHHETFCIIIECLIIREYTEWNTSK